MAQEGPEPDPAYRCRHHAASGLARSLRNLHFIGEGPQRFSRQTLRSPAKPKNIGNAIGPLVFIVTKGVVVYHYTASNGGLHSYYHDPNTGETYQSSAYW